ncbi:MAG: hypothetical protein QW261_03100 [Candidatus Jordarchaeaceae archaeon]
MSVGVEAFQIRDDGELIPVPLDYTNLSRALIVVDHNRKNIWFWKESEDLPKLLKVVGLRVANSLKLKYGLNYSTKEIVGKKEPEKFLILFENLPSRKDSREKSAERKSEFTQTQPMTAKMPKQPKISEREKIEIQSVQRQIAKGFSEIPISVNININLENLDSFDEKKLEDLIRRVREVLDKL